MGQVIVRYRILPDSPDNFEEIKAALEALDPATLEVEPIAFTLKAVIFTKLVEDRPGAEEELENAVNNIKHVDTIETISVTRTL